nr:unnamed protein product [Callosobruchus analis]
MFGFLMPAKLLDSQFECDLSHVLEDIDRNAFQMERKRLQQFVACSESEEDISGKGQRTTGAPPVHSKTESRNFCSKYSHTAHKARRIRL